MESSLNSDFYSFPQNNPVKKEERCRAHTADASEKRNARVSRARDATAHGNGGVMDFLDLAKSRYSERFFDKKPIEQEKMDRILEAGRIVPTACNYQPQHFYVIKSEEGLAKLKTVTHFHYNVPVMIPVCYDLREVWTNPGDRYYQNYNSGEQDASIAATTMMYEAEELGVHTIWIRGFDSKTVVDTFDLPGHMVPVMMLGLGYPNDRAKANSWHYKRKPIEDFVTEL